MARSKPTRKRIHGKSRLETLLEASIRQEITVKRLWEDLRDVSARVSVLECTDPALYAQAPPWQPEPKGRRMTAEESAAVDRAFELSVVPVEDPWPPAPIRRAFP